MTDTTEQLRSDPTASAKTQRLLQGALDVLETDVALGRLLDWLDACPVTRKALMSPFCAYCGWRGDNLDDRAAVAQAAAAHAAECTEHPLGVRIRELEAKLRLATRGDTYHPFCAHCGWYGDGLPTHDEAIAVATAHEATCSADPASQRIRELEQAMRAARHQLTLKVDTSPHTVAAYGFLGRALGHGATNGQ